MLIIPVGLEGRAVRRIPWVSLGLLAVNVIVAAVTIAVGAARENDIGVLYGLLRQALAAHPYLMLDADVARTLGDGVPLHPEAAPATVTADALRHQQRDLDALVEDYRSALDRLPSRRFGFIAKQPRPLAVLTAMFLHAGWLHLLGNMLILYVSAPYVEDVYGHALFAVAYLVSGVAATAGQYLAAPDSGVPLVGASGAIAGVMGMILVRLAATRIRFLFLPLVFLPNIRIPVVLPALVVLPLWVGDQLLSAAAAPADRGGVAFWAHVAGFAAGAVIAGVVRVAGLEARWMGRSAAADERDRSLEAAAQARQAGDHARARADLGRALAADPEGLGPWIEAYALAIDERDAGNVARALGRLLELMPRNGASADLVALLDEGRYRDAGVLPPRIGLAAATFLVGQGRAERALELCDEVAAVDPDGVLGLRAAVRAAEIARGAGRGLEARDRLLQARAHPACDAAWRETIDRALLEVDRAPAKGARGR
jgi:membrane associated rhomboid family serine protease